VDGLLNDIVVEVEEREGGKDLSIYALYMMFSRHGIASHGVAYL
jgi:hypothetical protein